MVNLSDRIRWEHLEAASRLLAAGRVICPESCPAPDQTLNDEAILTLFCTLVQQTGLPEIASQLEGPLCESVACAIQAAGEGDHKKVLESLQSLEAEGERSLLTGFQFWPPATSWDWIYEDLSSNYLPTIIAFCLAGFLEEFLPEDAGLAELDVHAAAPALALSLSPYLQLDQAGWDDCAQVARFPLKALLACYFDYTDNILLGEASRDEAQPEFVPWEDAFRLAEDYRQAEPVWEARPSEEDLADPWYIFRESVKSFTLAEGENEHGQ
jgi:hypothetical protein